MRSIKRNVAVICGGDSAEFDISVQSGKAVVAALDNSKYTAYLLFIKQLEWTYVDSQNNIYPVQKEDFSLLLPNGKILFDVVFNAIHGSPGEDGKLPAYLEMLGIPTTSCSAGILASTFNKSVCKKLVYSTGVALAKSSLIRKGEVIDEKRMVDNLGLPLFVKPNNNGSSVGVSKVKSVEELAVAVEKAFQEDHEVLMESFISGRELGCSVFEVSNRMIVFPITEIISKKEFFDYEAKYTKGMSDEITPANLQEEIEIEVKATAAMLYKYIGCKGFVRFDFILATDHLYFLEVNTVPGMTPASILPQQAKVMGIELSDLFGMAVENAISLYSIENQ